MVVSIYRRGSTQDIANYRAISLLTCAYQILTSIKQSRIAQVVDTGWGNTPSVLQLGKPRAGTKCSDTTARAQPRFVLVLRSFTWLRSYHFITSTLVWLFSDLPIDLSLFRMIKALYSRPTFQLEHDEFKSRTYVQAYTSAH